jgi:acyl-CoA thioester hydrolase
MDLLGHVNNVTYLDYLTEAREALFAGHPAATARVARHRVEFARPLVFRRTPVLVDSWVTDIGPAELVLAHEVYDAPADPGQQRTVYLRASTVLDHRPNDAERDLAGEVRGPAHAWRPLADEPRPAGDVHDLIVRRSDLDENGEARTGVFFEYFQEARIRYLMNLHTRGERWSQHVVARTDVDFLGPVRHRPEPYAVHSWVGHLGRRSFTIQSEVRDGDAVLARAAVVMVTFDLETQRTTEMAEQQRVRLEKELR